MDEAGYEAGGGEGALMVVKMGGVSSSIGGVVISIREVGEPEAKD